MSARCRTLAILVAVAVTTTTTASELDVGRVLAQAKHVADCNLPRAWEFVGITDGEGLGGQALVREENTSGAVVMEVDAQCGFHPLPRREAETAATCAGGQVFAISTSGTRRPYFLSATEKNFIGLLRDLDSTAKERGESIQIDRGHPIVRATGTPPKPGHVVLNEQLLRESGVWQPAYTPTGPRPVVSVIDDGIAALRPIAASLVCTFPFPPTCFSHGWSVTPSASSYSVSPLACTGNHATFVGGVVAAVNPVSPPQQFGIAPYALMRSWIAQPQSCDAPCDDPSARMTTVLAASNMPVDTPANVSGASRTQVLNMSWNLSPADGCPAYVSSVLQAIANTEKNLMVVASGNALINLNTISYRVCPAMLSFPSLLTTMEVKEKDGLLVYESSRGSNYVQLAVATNEICTTALGTGAGACPRDMAKTSGSSLAAAAVSAMGAAILAHPNYATCSAPQVAALLRCHACRPVDRANLRFEEWVNPLGGMANVAFLGAPKMVAGATENSCANWDPASIHSPSDCAAVIPDQDWSNQTCNGFEFKGGHQAAN